MSKHEYVERPGPLNAPNEQVRMGETERRWLCSCGATGKWFVATHLQPYTVDQRLRGHHDRHARTAER